MKKVLLMLGVLSAMACGSAFAQVAVGGQLGLNYQGVEDDSNVNFTLLPGATYELSNQLAIGGQIGIDYRARTSTQKQGEKSIKTTNSDFTFLLTPYVRYYALGVDRLSLYFDAQVPLSFGTVGSSTVDGKTTDGNGTFGIGLQVVPGLKFELSNQIALLATANVARFGVMYNSVSVKEGDKTVTTSATSFGLGVNHAGYGKDAALFMVGFQFSF